ncbi:MAG: tetratricopeptide repeat protein, partial [Bacteroidales bacterium]|nr:tetratricopeptide repeat protein [Bacteroidales bacterium]
MKPRYSFILVLLLVACNYVYSASEIDKLKNECALASDAHEVSCLNRLGIAYLDYAIDSALKYAEIAYEKSKLKGEKKEQAVAANTLARVNISFNNYDKAKSFINIAQQLSGNIKDEECLLMINFTKGELYKVLQEFEIAQEAYENCLHIGQDHQDNKYRLDAFNELGRIYAMQGNYEIALDLFNQGLKGYRRIGAATKVIELQNNLASMYLYIGKTEEALQMYKAGLD